MAYKVTELINDSHFYESVIYGNHFKHFLVLQSVVEG